eukprot:g1480.t1
MLLRLLGYLAFLWANTALGWTFVGEDASGARRGTGAAAERNSPASSPAPHVLHAWWLVLLAALTTLSLVTLTTTDPGRVEARKECSPSLLSPDGGGGGGGGGGEDSGPSGGAGGGLAQQQDQYFTQVCSLCNYLKPARAHHCRICNRCVLKMDHHCHWVGRCVGAGNYKAYLLTLFYACVSSGAMLVVLWRRWRMGRVGPDGASGGSGGFVGWVEMAGVTVDGLVLLFVFCAVSYLLIWHGYLVAGNVTTIEYFQWKRSMRDPVRYARPTGGSVRLSEYDAGLLSNCREALGEQVWLWLWPGLGDGCDRHRFAGGACRCIGGRVGSCCWGRGGGGVSVRGEEEEMEEEDEDDGGMSGAGGWWQGAAEAKKLLLLATGRSGRRFTFGGGARDGGDHGHRHGHDHDHDDRHAAAGGSGSESPVVAREDDQLKDDGGGRAVGGGSCPRDVEGARAGEGVGLGRGLGRGLGLGLGIEMTDTRPSMSMTSSHGRLEPA